MTRIRVREYCAFCPSKVKVITKNKLKIVRSFLIISCKGTRFIQISMQKQAVIRQTSLLQTKMA